LCRFFTSCVRFFDFTESVKCKALIDFLDLGRENNAVTLPTSIVLSVILYFNP